MGQSWFCATSVLAIMMWCMCVMLICTLTNFLKFHLRLVLENYTTIENLEREEGAKSKFDIGRRGIGSRCLARTLGCGGAQCIPRPLAPSAMASVGGCATRA